MSVPKIHITIPVIDYKTREWTSRNFTKKEYIDYIESQYKLPGRFDFKKEVHIFRETMTSFINNKRRYCTFKENTRDSDKFWEFEMTKIKNGMIITTDNGREYFITKYHYWYLNFIEIPDKVEHSYKYPEFWDTDVWYFYCIELCELKGLQLLGVKKRQIGITLKNLAITLHKLWWSDGDVVKMLAYDIKYVESAWKFLDDYRDFLNTYTPFFRGFSPSKTLNWKQQIEYTTDDGRKIFIGNKSSLVGVTVKDKPANAVSGKIDLAVIEEPGVAPNLGKLLGFLKAAIMAGNKATGLSITIGSVGELKDAEPLKQMMYNPEVNNCLSFDGSEWCINYSGNKVGMFIPANYSYYAEQELEDGSSKMFIDEYGNSDLEGAKQHILYVRTILQKGPYEDYQRFITQNPLYIEEAFADTQENIFPTDIIKPHYDYLTSDTSIEMPVILYYDKDNNLKFKYSPINNKILDYPVSKTSNKEGQVIFYEPPPKDPQYGMYVAGVDPVKMIKTSTSESLMSCYIYKCSHSVNNELTEDKLVAEYVGRHDDVVKTFKLVTDLCQLYNARILIENNQESYIQWLMKEKKQMTSFLPQSLLAYTAMRMS